MAIHVYRCTKCGYIDEHFVPAEAIRGLCLKCNAPMVRAKEYERPVIVSENTPKGKK